MKKIKKATICLGIVLCTLIGTSIMGLLIEDPPSALSSPVHSYKIC